MSSEVRAVESLAIHISGVVQGVGFRPFVYALARRHHLGGWVRNTSAGVDIMVDGRADILSIFIQELQQELPPLARIDNLEIASQPASGFDKFEIIESAPIAGAFQPISPDVSLCADCLRELYDPADRRYRYPFINCTNCGPRFTIIQDIPYDRPRTTMAPFALCPACAADYENPLDRRFHAQPVACPDCGPQVWLVGGQEAGGRGQAEVLEPKLPITNYQFLITGDPIQQARHLLATGKILAIKGLGGFHLACDATNATAVNELRRGKLRVDKPFALMVADVETAGRHCHLNEAEKELLTSRERPIVLLRRRDESPITAVAPRQKRLGVMLPYTPLHQLLLEQAPGFPEALVMTSGNLSEEPIAFQNEEAIERLAALADAFLLHNRGIHIRCDDSVMQVLAINEPDQGFACMPVPIRRSRGFAPNPIKLPVALAPILAVGAELKNTFCLTRDDYAFMSHHIGDLENYETLCSFEGGITHFERLFRIRPQVIAYDKHPNYLATRYALERAAREHLPAVGVQHHHAHIAACMAEHGLSGERAVIGVALDGTGYGDDGTIWGGEFLVADTTGYKRPYHLQPVPLPGGDSAVRQPWRMALAWLLQADIPWADDLAPVQYARRGRPQALAALRQQLKTGLNAPLTSSMGRLFDAVSALIGVRQAVNYEAQAAIELEALVEEAERGVYPIHIEGKFIQPGPMLVEIVSDLRNGVAVAVIAARFHNTIAEMVTAVCQRLKTETGLDEVILSGGVWQNLTLLKITIPRLQAVGFTVYWHQTVPANDGGIALGQALIAGKLFREGRLS